MNGVSIIQTRRGLPATVLRLSRKNPVQSDRNDAAEQTLIAAVTHPPRIGEARPLAALMPELLARYGIAGKFAGGETTQQSIDMLA